MRSAIRFSAPWLLLVSVVAFGGRRAPANASPDPAPSDDANRVNAGGDERGQDPSAAPADDGADEDDTDDDDLDDARAADDDDDGEGASALAERDAGKKHKRPHGGCPSNMARVRDFCIDRYEAPNRRGARPLVMQSANDAVEWCGAHHKRVCTEDEWIATCEGDEHRTYPYGAEHVDGRCNDDKAWRTVSEATLAKWPAPEAHAHARELYQATPSGSKHKCASETGVGDLTGNVEEWVVRTRDHANDWPYLLIGCYWSGCYGGGKPTCHSTNDAHGPEFRFYETGFRCCRDAATPKKAATP